MTPTLEMEQKQVLKNEIEPMIRQAQEIVVKNADQRAAAARFAADWKTKKKLIEERFHPTANKETARAAWQAALDTEKAFYEPIDKAIEIVGATVKQFDRDEAKKAQEAAEAAENKRREDERKLREKAEAEAAAEEAKAKAKADDLRKKEEAAKEAERKAIEEGNAKAAAEAAAQAAKLKVQAANTEAAGVQKAEGLREKAENITVAPTFQPAPTATKKLIWKVRVINPLLACRSIGEGLAGINLVEFKVSALNDLGKGYDGTAKVPGFEFYQDVQGRL